MGKKKQRAQYISKGIVGTTKSRSKRDPDYASRRLMNQFDAFLKGKNVVLTIENPDKSETNRPYIKVPAHTVWKGRTR